ncbi:unnamed protein product [Moneuplotes crassus]|uniref:Uncharacterized protein n=1 Tax=Euplotes crassus TaxID=5936 RepID=A0AAD1X996_EUPCR|nr:unnamed protein product [Moneuplotes crassus]
MDDSKLLQTTFETELCETKSNSSIAEIIQSNHKDSNHKKETQEIKEIKRNPQNFKLQALEKYLMKTYPLLRKRIKNYFQSLTSELYDIDDIDTTFYLEDSIPSKIDQKVRKIFEGIEYNQFDESIHHPVFPEKDGSAEERDYLDRLMKVWDFLTAYAPLLRLDKIEPLELYYSIQKQTETTRLLTRVMAALVSTLIYFQTSKVDEVLYDYKKSYRKDQMKEWHKALCHFLDPAWVPDDDLDSEMDNTLGLPSELKETLINVNHMSFCSLEKEQKLQIIEAIICGPLQLEEDEQYCREGYSLLDLDKFIDEIEDNHLEGCELENCIETAISQSYYGKPKNDNEQTPSASSYFKKLIRGPTSKISIGEVAYDNSEVFRYYIYPKFTHVLFGSRVTQGCALEWFLVEDIERLRKGVSPFSYPEFRNRLNFYCKYLAKTRAKTHTRDKPITHENYWTRRANQFEQRT